MKREIHVVQQVSQVITMKKQIQTVKGRIDGIYQVSKNFEKHLIEPRRGATLRPSYRYAVAQCARDAIYCLGCTSLQQVCLRSGTSSTKSKTKPAGVAATSGFASICHNTKHDDPIKLEKHRSSSSSSSTTAIESLLTSTIHAIVNHQVKLDKAWFDDTVSSIKKSGLIKTEMYAKDMDANYLNLIASSCLTEIITISAMSHGIHVALLLLDKIDNDATAGDITFLSNQQITIAEDDDHPSYLDLTKLLRQVRYDDKITASPYYTSKDILKSDGNSEWTKLSDFTKNQLPKMTDPMGPSTGIFIAPEDWCFFGRQCVSKLYLTGMFVSFAKNTKF